MTKILWNTSFLEEKAEQLRITPSVQFWECDSDGNVMKFTEEHYKKMIKNFFPFLGVYNLQMGENEKGVPTSTLVLVCENRCEEIDSKTLKSITFKILNNLGSLGSDIRTTFYKASSNPVFNRESLKLIPDLEGKTPFADNLLAAYRFFENGWIEITSNGVSQLKSYSELPDDVIVWNSSVIPKNYKNTETLEVLEKQLTGINANGIHPHTGENIYKKEDRKDLSKEWADIRSNFLKETQNFEIAPNLYNCFNALTYQQTHCEQRVKDDIKGARVRMESLLNGKCGNRIDLVKNKCLALTR